MEMQMRLREDRLQVHQLSEQRPHVQLRMLRTDTAPETTPRHHRPALWQPCGDGTHREIKQDQTEDLEIPLRLRNNH